MVKRLNFSWRYQPRSDTKTYHLIKYLQSQPQGIKTKLILDALTAYYYPLAHLAGTTIEKKKLTFEAIFTLIAQIQLLANHCGIDENQLRTLVFDYFKGQSTANLPPTPISQPQPQEEDPTEFDPNLLSFGNFMIKKDFR